jgi:hypothetical protein
VVKRGRKSTRPHDDAGYRKRRKLLLATVTPATRCARCGRRADQHPLHKNGRPGWWEAGHTIPGNNAAPLVLEFSVCNRSAGGRLGGERRWSGNGGKPGPRPIGPHWPGHYDLTDPQAVGAPPCVVYGGGLCETCSSWRANQRRVTR